MGTYSAGFHSTGRRLILVFSDDILKYVITISVLSSYKLCNNLPNALAWYGISQFNVGLVVAVLVHVIDTCFLPL